MIKLLIVPRFLALVVLFVTAILLSFLLLGCVEPADSYSKLYLVSLSHEKKESEGSTLLLGYLNACLNSNGSIACSSYGKLPDMLEGLSTVNSDVLKVAKKFSSTCPPHLLIITICLTLSALAVQAYSLVPILPAKTAAKKVCMSLTVFTVLFWGLGAMLQDKLVGSMAALSSALSVKDSVMSIGRRARIITWTAFSLMVVVAGCCGVEVFRSRELQKQEIMQKTQKTNLPQKAYFYV